MAYPNEGTLVTDAREIAISETWDTQTDWEAFQSASNVVIENGVVMLEDQDPIPESAVWQIDVQDESYSDGESVTTLTDQVGSADATGTGIYRASAINGFPAVELDGTDDEWDASPGQYGPWVLYAVGLAQVEQLHQFIGSGGSDFPAFYLNDGNNGYILAEGGGATVANIPETTVSLTVPFIATLRIDGTATNEYLLRVNGNEDSGSASAADIFNVHVGSRPDSNDRWFDGYWGFAELHDGIPSNGLQTREQEIADMWGITL